MALRTLDPRTSILTLLTHPAYSSCRLQAHPLGAPHAQVFQDRSSEGMQVLTQEITLTNGLLAAQAQVSAAGAQLDVVASRVSKAALTVTNDDRSHALYLHLFEGKSISHFRRPVLGKQHRAMRGWVGTLQQSPHPELSALLPELQAALAEADTAEAARIAAQDAMRQFRDVGARRQWVDRLNATRKQVYGVLAMLPHEHPGLASDFADHFFLSAPPRDEDAQEEEETSEGLRAQIAELLEEVTALQERLAEVEAAEAEEQKAAAARAAEEAALAELERAMAEMEQKRAALKARLEKAA